MASQGKKTMQYYRQHMPRMERGTAAYAFTSKWSMLLAYIVAVLSITCYLFGKLELLEWPISGHFCDIMADKTKDIFFLRFWTQQMAHYAVGTSFVQALIQLGYILLNVIVVQLVANIFTRLLCLVFCAPKKEAPRSTIALEDRIKKIEWVSSRAETHMYTMRVIFVVVLLVLFYAVLLPAELIQETEPPKVGAVFIVAFLCILYLAMAAIPLVLISLGLGISLKAIQLVLSGIIYGRLPTRIYRCDTAVRTKRREGYICHTQLTKTTAEEHAKTYEAFKGKLCEERADFRLYCEEIGEQNGYSPEKMKEKHDVDSSERYLCYAELLWQEYILQNGGWGDKERRECLRKIDEAMDNALKVSAYKDSNGDMYLPAVYWESSDVFTEEYQRAWRKQPVGIDASLHARDYVKEREQEAESRRKKEEESLRSFAGYYRSKYGDSQNSSSAKGDSYEGNAYGLGWAGASETNSSSTTDL